MFTLTNQYTQIDGVHPKITYFKSIQRCIFLKIPITHIQAMFLGVLIRLGDIACKYIRRCVFCGTFVTKWEEIRMVSQCESKGASTIGRSKGAPSVRPPPQQDPILSFSHTFSLKSSPASAPPPTARRPPTGNPISATGNLRSEN